MRSIELLPGATITVPVGGCTDVPGGFRMRVRAFSPPAFNDRSPVVSVRGELLDRDHQVDAKPRRWWRVDVRGAVLDKPSTGPLCTSDDCGGRVSMYIPTPDGLRPACAVHRDDVLRAAGISVPIETNEVQHAPEHEVVSGRAVLTCQCGWRCWVGDEHDDLVERRWPVLSAAHAIAGWSIRPIGGTLDGVAFEGILPGFEWPCWLWRDPRTGDPALLWWDARADHLMRQPVHADGTAADEPFALEKWPTAPQEPLAGDVDGEMELKRARDVALTHVGDSTGLAWHQVTPDRHC